MFAWLFRCRLYPGKKAVLPLAGLTDDRFALVVRAPDAPAESAGSPTVVARLSMRWTVQERDEEEQYK